MSLTGGVVLLVLVTLTAPCLEQRISPGGASRYVMHRQVL